MKKTLVYMALLAMSTAPAFGAVKFVAASGDNSNGNSWATAYQSLQTALANVSSGDEIWVKAGIYKPHASTKTVAFDMVDGVDVYGGFAGTETLRTQRDPAANVTILSGDLSGDDDNSGFPVMDTAFTNSHDDNSYHVVRSLSSVDSSILDGFTISGGNRTGVHPYCGGGIYVYNGVTTVVNCIFTGNHALKGGAVGTTVGDFINCKIYGNYSTEEGAINIMGGTSFFYNCVISENANGAVRAIDSSTFINCVLNDDNGPALFVVTDCTSTLINCTVRGDIEGYDFNPYPIGTLIMTNCILWDDNGGDASEIDGFTSITVTYSCIEGGYTGTGNTSSNPTFVDADGGDNIDGTLDDNFRLQPTSPAINTGSNAALPDDLADLDGDSNTGEDIPLDLDDTARVKYTTVDMGAYEYAFTLVSALSRKTHGGAGDFDIDLPLSGSYATEPRNDGPTKILATFNWPPSSSSPGVSSGSVGSTSVAGNVLTVNTTGITDESCFSMDFNNGSGVTDAGSHAVYGDDDVHVVRLEADLDFDGDVDQADEDLIKDTNGDPLDQYNFWYDITISGTITVGDQSYANSRDGDSASCP